MHYLQKYHTLFNQSLEEFKVKKEPQSLYEPINYILELGGKRLRPILTLMTCELFGTEVKKAIPAALAVEVFHNFSLIHDDIMDEAPLRRGKATVHQKWDLNTGILSGDAMLILAYQLFESYEPQQFQKLAKLFSKTALEVCEGQQYDVDFETRNDVTIPQYIKMIEYKTSVLVAAAMQMGAIIAQASEEDEHLIYEFGRYLGIAFQIQDDFLDAYGDPEKFGKQIGGDIIENKKTFLYLKALEFSSEKDKENLDQLFNSKPKNPSEKVDYVKSLFESCGATKAVKLEIESYTNKAFEFLNQLSLNEEKKDILRSFGESLMNRSF